MAHSGNGDRRRLETRRAAVDLERSEDFETAQLDAADPVVADREEDTVADLARYLQGVTYATYRREDFDAKLDAAKLAVQYLNYRKHPHRGYLRDEIFRLRTHFDTIPSAAGRTAGVLAFVWAAAAGAGVFATGAVAGLSKAAWAPEAAWVALAAAGAAVICVLTATTATYVRRWVWWRQVEYKNAGVTQAKAVRQKNHDVLVNSIRNLQLISAERARNKDPDRGATGLLQIYLSFICGYTLHKTLNRCYTRFDEDLRERFLPGAKARINTWRTRAVVATVAGGVAAVAAGPALLAGSTEPVKAVAAVLSLLSVPLGATWLTARHLHARSVRPGSRTDQRLTYLEGLYRTQIPARHLEEFEEPPTERKRFDWVSINAYNDVESYASWLHGVLVALKRHEDETGR